MRIPGKKGPPRPEGGGAAGRQAQFYKQRGLKPKATEPKTTDAGAQPSTPPCDDDDDREPPKKKKR